jgi:hypothetical protein
MRTANGERRSGPVELCFRRTKQDEKSVTTPWRSIVEMDAERTSKRHSTISVVVA